MASNGSRYPFGYFDPRFAHRWCAKLLVGDTPIPGKRRWCSFTNTPYSVAFLWFRIYENHNFFNNLFHTTIQTWKNIPVKSCNVLNIYFCSVLHMRTCSYISNMVWTPVAIILYSPVTFASLLACLFDDYYIRTYFYFEFLIYLP